MKRFILLLAGICALSPVFAQKNDFSYNFYGFVRGDLFYNTRANVAPVDGNFYMYPMDKEYDAVGKDLNDTPNGSFYTFTTRLGLNVSGPVLGNARTSAKIEADFGGFSSSTTMFRIRQAYVALDWDKSQLLVGQTWHPLSGSVLPDVLNLSTGAPFNAFNRSPMLRYRYKMDKIIWTAATIWQLQYQSAGPAGASEDYIKNSCVPELFIGADFTSNGWLSGIGVHLISLVPRTASTVQEDVFKVNERITGFSYLAHFRYTGRNYMIAGKTTMASMLDHSAMLGGYGVSSIKDPVTGKQEYTPFRHSSSWINATVGTEWKAGIFAGYTKNLGTSDKLEESMQTYGKGLNIDHLYMINPSVSYNRSHWKIGLEYCLSAAYYGTNKIKDGKVSDTHAVRNHRILGLMVYMF